jgi:hypothetical protein
MTPEPTGMSGEGPPQQEREAEGNAPCVDISSSGDQRRVVGELAKPDDGDTPSDASRVETRLKIAAPANLFTHRRQRSDDTEDHHVDKHVGCNLRPGRPLAATWLQCTTPAPDAIE